MLETSTTSPQQEIDRDILNCIDKGLNFLDQSTKRSIYWHIENSFGVSREKIIERPDDFLKAIRGMFGQGSFFLESKISEQIRLEFKVGYSKRAMSLPELIAVARKEIR